MVDKLLTDRNEKLFLKKPIQKNVTARWKRLSVCIIHFEHKQVFC